MSSSDRPFRRQLFGYRRADVDEHLTAVDASIADLRTAVDRAAEPAHHDLVQRATRLAVDEILQRVHDDAARIREEAEAEASRLLADAYEIVVARESVIDLRPETEATPASHPEGMPTASHAAEEAWQADLGRGIDD